MRWSPNRLGESWVLGCLLEGAVIVTNTILAVPFKEV